MEQRLEVLKALGDNTRYAIYLELARSSAPRSTAEVAEALGLHPNTVRPHLERMRDVGLLQVETDARGAVGRPQHRYALAPDAPSLGLEPPAFPLLAALLAGVAAAAGATTGEAVGIGRQQGAFAARQRTSSAACVEALAEELGELGFDPAVGDDETGTVVAFAHCPYRELAEAFPDLVCEIHRGMVQGFVDTWGGAQVVRFGKLTDRNPCQVSLSPG